MKAGSDTPHSPNNNWNDSFSFALGVNNVPGQNKVFNVSESFFFFCLAGKVNITSIVPTLS